jgi:hypothetical protein
VRMCERCGKSGPVDSSDDNVLPSLRSTTRPAAQSPAQLTPTRPMRRLFLTRPKRAAEGGAASAAFLGGILSRWLLWQRGNAKAVNRGERKRGTENFQCSGPSTGRARQWRAASSLCLTGVWWSTQRSCGHQADSRLEQLKPRQSRRPELRIGTGVLVCTLWPRFLTRKTCSVAPDKLHASIYGSHNLVPLATSLALGAAVAAL